MLVDLLLLRMTLTQIYHRAASLEFHPGDPHTHLSLLFQSVTFKPVACVGVDVESRDSFLKRKLFIFAFYTFKVSFVHQAKQPLLHFYKSTLN